MIEFQLKNLVLFSPYRVILISYDRRYKHPNTCINKKTFVYMFSLAGQTAGPDGLKFFVDTHKNLNYYFLFPWAPPGPSARNIYTCIDEDLVL